jgi:hypothetical protein
MDNISANLLWTIFKHVRSWLANLDRASQARKASVAWVERLLLNPGYIEFFAFIYGLFLQSPPPPQ